MPLTVCRARCRSLFCLPGGGRALTLDLVMDLTGVAGARAGVNTTSKGDRMINPTPATAALPDRTAAGPPDSEVIRRSQDEPDLFAVLFRRHAAGLGRYVTRRLGHDLAQDIVAETFLAAFRQRGGEHTAREGGRASPFRSGA